jgi:glycosyltransferase 2 family protein
MRERLATAVPVVLSLAFLGIVVWWALRQEPPELPRTQNDLVALLGALGFYTLATLLRAERWHLIVRRAEIPATRRDTYPLTTVGYMGNNVLPARAGEALRVVLLSPRCNAGKRTLISSIVAERVLDVIVLLTIFVGTVYGVLETSEVLPTDRPLLVTGIGILLLLAAAVAIWVLRRHHFFERVRDWLRPLADSPRAVVSRWGLVLLAATFLLWTIEASVYWTVAQAIEMDISISGALYLVALTNFVAALPAAPGSIGTFDAAVAWGTHRLGVAGSVAVSYVILIRFVLYVPITIVGLVVLVTRYGGWSRLRSATRLEASRA